MGGRGEEAYPLLVYWLRMILHCQRNADIFHLNQCNYRKTVKTCLLLFDIGEIWLEVIETA